jgi:hypothetical protein
MLEEAPRRWQSQLMRLLGGYRHFSSELTYGN